MNYQIPILRTRIKKKQLTSMHLIAGFMYMLIAATTWVIINTIIKVELMKTLNILSGFYFTAGILLIAFTIIFNRKIAVMKINIITRIIEIILFGFIISYSLYQGWIMIGIYGGVGLIAISLTLYNEINASKAEYIIVKEDAVYFQNKIKKVLTWPNIKNLILKHGNFTINTRDNVLIQYPLKKDELKNADEIEKYALQQIEKNKEHYQEDWK